MSLFFFTNNFYKNKETFNIFSPQILEVYRILLVETTLESIMFYYTFSVINTMFVPCTALLYETSRRLAEPIDHLPTIVELNHKICYKPVIPRSARWRRNGVDWSSFTNEVESKMSNLPNEPNLSLRGSCFNKILMSAATTHVGKSKPSKISKPWMAPHVRAKISNLNRLRQKIHQNRQE